MEKNRMKLRGNMVRGVAVSKYGLEHGYLDYAALSRIVGDCILNNTLVEETPYEDWEVLNDELVEDRDIYQYYIISDTGYSFLERYTDEIVLYNETLDIYLWAITHFGTAWDYVLTDIELYTEPDMNNFFERVAKEESEAVAARINRIIDETKED